VSSTCITTLAYATRGKHFHASASRVLCHRRFRHDADRWQDCRRDGKTIEGGVEQKFAKGDWLMVPSGVPHQFIDIKSPITILSLHLPNAK
jgi:hypothetical protein